MLPHGIVGQPGRTEGVEQLEALVCHVTAVPGKIGHDVGEEGLRNYQLGRPTAPASAARAGLRRHEPLLDLVQDCVQGLLRLLRRLALQDVEEGLQGRRLHYQASHLEGAGDPAPALRGAHRGR